MNEFSSLFHLLWTYKGKQWSENWLCLSYKDPESTVPREVGWWVSSAKHVDFMLILTAAFYSWWDTSIQCSLGDPSWLLVLPHASSYPCQTALYHQVPAKWAELCKQSFFPHYQFTQVTHLFELQKHTTLVWGSYLVILRADSELFKRITNGRAQETVMQC